MFPNSRQDEGKHYYAMDMEYDGPISGADMPAIRRPRVRAAANVNGHHPHEARLTRSRAASLERGEHDRYVPLSQNSDKKKKKKASKKASKKKGSKKKASQKHSNEEKSPSPHLSRANFLPRVAPPPSLQATMDHLLTQYRKQCSDLQALGFTDTELNLLVLNGTKGDVMLAITWLIDNVPNE